MQNSVWNVNEKPRIGGAAHVQYIGSDPTDPSGTFLYFFIFLKKGVLESGLFRWLEEKEYCKIAKKAVW